MSEIPVNLHYARSHEWVRELDDGTVEVGISDHAQQSLGDLVFIELPEVGRELEAGEACAVVESVKAASDVYSPISGRVVAVNEQLSTAPELVNQQPYGEGWLMKMAPARPVADADLLDAAGYTAVAAAG